MRLKRFRLSILALVALALLAGCATTSTNQRAALGFVDWYNNTYAAHEAAVSAIKAETSFPTMAAWQDHNKRVALLNQERDILMQLKPLIKTYADTVQAGKLVPQDLVDNIIALQTKYNALTGGK